MVEDRTGFPSDTPKAFGTALKSMKAKKQLAAKAARSFIA